MRFAVQEANLLVYPAYTLPPAFDLPVGRLQTNLGGQPSSRPDDSAEFLHIREYRPGDNPRHVHWPSWARLGAPTVKVYQEDEGLQVALILDTGATNPEATDAFESAVSLTAGIAAYLTQQGYGIDTLITGDTVHHVHRHRGNPLQQVLSLLADIRITPDITWPAVTATLLGQTPQLSTAMFILLDWSDATAACINQLLTHGLGIRILVVHNGSTTITSPPWPATLYQQIVPDAINVWDAGQPAEATQEIST